MRILFFDGYCTLCNGLVDWVIRKDRSGNIQFASLQAETAKKILAVDSDKDFDTVVYQRDGHLHERSDAILLLLHDIGGVWRLAVSLKIIPRFIRDAIYRIIAKNRYRFFKKRETCRMPTPEEKKRLLS